MANLKEKYDYIVVGGGSAGCVIANRLVKAGKEVLLLEEGPADNSQFIHMPATFIRVIGTERTFVYRAEPSEKTNGRAIAIPQGRTLGGGSSVNAMVYIRGQAQDYDDWETSGCPGWGWNSVLPVFKRAEKNERLADGYHGNEGTLRVSDAKHKHPLSLAFVKGAQQAGLPYNDDFNGATQEGAGFYQTTTFDGKRGSTASTYLREAAQHSNLTVLTHAKALRLQIEEGAVTGVFFRGDKGQEKLVRCADEVILTAGALATPRLLMLSGIGPQAMLEKAGVTVVKDLPGVGKNYQDHLEVPVYGRTKDPISLFGQDKGLKALRHGIQYKAFGSGLLTSTVVETGAFVDADGDGRPEIQFHVLPALAGDMDREPLPGHGITLNPCFLRPESRGQVTLRSSDPDQELEIDGQYLSEQSDVDAMVRGLKVARKIMRQPAVQELIEEELLPSNQAELTDQALEDHVRQYAKTVYHPAGTCKMGTDAAAVVDPELRVYGIAGVRVCDASVMPSLVSGNTNAPTIMIAERCADFILG